MNIHITPELRRVLIKSTCKNKLLYQKIEKQLQLFKQNHQHPSLRTHKLSGNLADAWSISIDKSIRMLYFLENNEAYFFDIGTHDQVYK